MKETKGLFFSTYEFSVFKNTFYCPWHRQLERMNNLWSVTEVAEVFVIARYVLLIKVLLNQNFWALGSVNFAHVRRFKWENRSKWTKQKVKISIHQYKDSKGMAPQRHFLLGGTQHACTLFGSFHMMLCSFQAWFVGFSHLCSNLQGKEHAYW